MKRIVLPFLIVSLCMQSAVAQNARFSQVFSAPMQLNPSLAGRFDGKVRVTSLFSFQQTLLNNGPVYSSMNHQNISFDIKLGHYRASGDDNQIADNGKENKVSTKEAKDVVGNNNPNGYWAAGATFYHYGHSSNPMDASFYSVSLARHFYNKSNKFYGFGAQATYATGCLDNTRGANYDIEISGGGFRYPTASPTTSNGAGHYVDFSVGGYYGMVTEPVMFEIGAALNNFHYPNNSLVGDKESELRHRVTVDGLLRLKLNPKWGIVMKTIYWHDGLYLNSKKPDSDSLYPHAFWSGIEFYKINPLSPYNINFGLYTRNFLSLIPYISINATQYANIRYTYEYPLNQGSVVKFVPYRHEVAAIFTLKRNTAPGTKFYKKLNYW